MTDENDILDGRHPEAGSVVIAGREFKLEVPKAKRGRRVLAAYGELTEASKRDPNDPATALAQMEACDKLRAAFSEEFEAAEDWLLENATETELLELCARLVKIAVPRPANSGANAQPSPPKNRAQRRAKKK